nr:NADH dehydrogenase [ubiquinone] flavoprotein 3, mitochondrial-like [Vicugna pacos]
MAASLLLRQGRAGALKTVLEARVFRGLAATVSLSAESGKNEKGLPPNPKKQSPPKRAAQAADSAEPFDNSTYKNLQHHDYSTYTFLDLNLDLLKFQMRGPRVGNPQHTSSLRAISQFAIACGSHGCPHWFSKLDIWGTHIQGASLKVGVSSVGFKPFTSQGEAPDFELPSGYIRLRVSGTAYGPSKAEKGDPKAQAGAGLLDQLAQWRTWRE